MGGRGTNRRLRLGALCALVAAGAGGAFAAAAPGRSTAGPISSLTVTDPVGDAVGAGGDLQSITYTVSTDGVLSLAATYSNRSDLGAAPSTQFDIDSQDDSASANVAAFSGYPSQLSIWSNGDWVEQHQLPAGTWSGHTFTLTVALSDLQNTLHVPVTPTLRIAALSVEQNGDQVSTDDAVPDNGWTIISTQASAPVSTALAPTPPAPPTVTAPGPAAGAAPSLSQTVVRLPHDRLEWKRLVVRGVPAGERVAIACTRLCSVSESPPVAGGTAVSRRFVGVPFPQGATFLVRVLRPSGTGWWFRATVLARTGAPTSWRRGCIAPGGALAAGSRC